MSKVPPFAFFGTPEIAVTVLNALHTAGYTPDVVITNPDAPQGRKMVLTPSPVKVWALAHAIPVLEPPSLRSDSRVYDYMKQHGLDLGVVVAYGKIIPESLLSLPHYGCINVHPSLLPRFRGASPIRSAILHDERDTGVSIMLLDREVDHGPILAQEQLTIREEEWPLRGRTLDQRLAEKGGELLCTVLPGYIEGDIIPQPQDHTKATFCDKISKEMGELSLTDDPYHNLLKIRAFDGWPGTYFFTERHGKRIRVKIVDAELAPDGTLRILRVIPEGKNEIAYEEFMR